MWKHKDEEEVKKIRQRKKNEYKKIWRPFICAVIVFLVGSIQTKIGFSKYAIVWFDPITWKEFYEEWLLTAFWIGMIAFFVVYAWQIISKRPVFSGPDAMICMNCNKYKYYDKKYKCDCGGEFVPLDELDWVDEEEASSKNAG